MFWYDIKNRPHVYFIYIVHAGQQLAPTLSRNHGEIDVIWCDLVYSFFSPTPSASSFSSTDSTLLTIYRFEICRQASKWTCQSCISLSCWYLVKVVTTKISFCWCHCGCSQIHRVWIAGLHNLNHVELDEIFVQFMDVELLSDSFYHQKMRVKVNSGSTSVQEETVHVPVTISNSFLNWLA
jgi:hypothetical protein